MKQLFYYALFWMLSGSVYVRGNAEATVTTQTFSQPHIKNNVTEDGSVRLKEIDATNPLFIFK